MSVSRQINNERAHNTRARNKQLHSERISCIALVLSAQTYGESDLIIDLFTQQRGRTRAIARGALRSKRRYMGALEPGTLLKVDYPIKSGLPTLGSCDIVSSHRTLRQGLSTLKQLYYILELLLVTTPEDEPDEVLFESAVELLAALESAAGLPAPLLYAWELKLLAHLGYELRISRCPHTGDAPDGLSYRDGGAISSRAGRPYWPVETETLRKLYLLQRGQLTYRDRELELSEAEDTQLRFALSNLWGEITGRALKSVRVLRQLQLDSVQDYSLASPRPSMEPAAMGSAAMESATPSVIPSRSMMSTGVSLTALMVLIPLLTFISLCCVGCHGITESIPSKGTFSVDRAQDDALGSNAQQTPRSSDHPPRVALKHPKGLPSDPNQLQILLASSSEHTVTVGLRVQSEPSTPSPNHAEPHRDVYCGLQGSWLSAAIFDSLSRSALSVKSSQSGLWIEHELPDFMKEVQSRNELTRYLRRTYKSSGVNSSPDLIRVYDPTRDRGGQWIIYFTQDANTGAKSAQSLILLKSAPWIYDQAWVIGECEVNQTLRELTHAPLNIQRKLTSPLQLKLISAELQTSTVDD